MKTSLRTYCLLILLFGGVSSLLPVHAAYGGSQVQPYHLSDKKIVTNTAFTTQAEAYQQALALKDQTIATLHQELTQTRETYRETITAKDRALAIKDQTIATLRQALTQAQQQMQKKVKKTAFQKEEAQEEQKEEPAVSAPDIRQALQTFKANLKKYNVQGGKWYQGATRKEIGGLQAAYLFIRRTRLQREAALLAHAWASFPRIKGSNNLWTKYDYLAIKTVWLKRKLAPQAQSKLVCASEYSVNREAQDYCWYHGPKQNPAQTPEEAMLYTVQGTPDFDAYLRAFRQGLQAYDIKRGAEEIKYSKSLHKYGWYAEWIEKEIQGLQKAYPKIQDNALQKNVERLAYALAGCPRFEKFDLLFHFMVQQNGLLKLKLSTENKLKDKVSPTLKPKTFSFPELGNMVKNDVVYTPKLLQGIVVEPGWHHSINSIN